jgi:integrase
MARAVRDARLETRSAREKLKARGKPYFKALDPGLHLGYRKGAAGGKWVLRRYLGDGAYEVETIAVADDKADAGDGEVVLNFQQAQQEARKKHVEHMRAAKGLPADGGPYTVRACIEDYLAFLETNRKTGRDARYRADALILPPLGDIPCAELTKDMLRAWLGNLAASPPRVRTRRGQIQQHRWVDDDEGRRRRKAAANRVLANLKAALNRAWRDGKIETDAAWRRVEPFKGADAARVRYLSIEECRRLINAAEGAFRDLVRAALATGCRYGELAALEVADFNADSGTLRVRQSKSGRSRHVVLTEEGIALFSRLAAGRPGSELLLRRPNGEPWGRNNQQEPMAAACEHARIEPPAGFHSLRHSYASHAVLAGAPLLVIARNLGHSDSRMVEKHYGHLSQGYVADEIRRAAPRFGAIADDNRVTAIAGAR